jgi:hypothetical protein
MKEHTIMKAKFSVGSMPRLCNDQMPLQESPEMAVRRVGGWCEMAASLRGRESRSRGSSTVGRCYQAEQWRPWLRTLVFIWQWFVKCSHELCVKVSSKSDYQSEPHPSFNHMTTGVRSGIGLKIALCNYSIIPWKWNKQWNACRLKWRPYWKPT